VVALPALHEGSRVDLEKTDSGVLAPRLGATPEPIWQVARDPSEMASSESDQSHSWGEPPMLLFDMLLHV
jgi:hypothetical protein